MVREVSPLALQKLLRDLKVPKLQEFEEERQEFVVHGFVAERKLIISFH